jgi:hypothetical protein
MTDATNGTGTADFSGTHDFTTVFCGVRVDQSLVFLFVFCDHWLSFFFCVLLRCTDAYYAFGIFKIYFIS